MVLNAFSKVPARYERGGLAVQNTNNQQRIPFEATNRVINPAPQHTGWPLSHGQRLTCYLEITVGLDVMHRG